MQNKISKKDLFELQLSVALGSANFASADVAAQDTKFQFRLLADECLSDRTFFSLLRAGFDVTRSPRGLQDKDVFALATTSNRVLVTHDYDFLNHAEYDPAFMRGTLVLPTYRKHPDALLKYTNACDAALDYFMTKLPLAPCWWFYKLVVFRAHGEFDVQTLAPILNGHSIKRAFSRATYRFMP